MLKHAILLLGVLWLHSAFAADEGAKGVPFTARVAVAADGRAMVSDLSGPKGTLAQAVLDQLAKVRFVPARRESVAVAAEARLHGQVVLTPVGSDEYDVSLRYLSTRPSIKEARPPDYPPDRLRAGENAGTVALRVRVDTQGRAADVVVLTSSHLSYEQAVRRVIPQWRFVPPPEETTVVVPVVFRREGTRAVIPEFQCIADETRPNVEGDTGCTDRFEIRGAVVRHGEVRI